MPETSSKLIPRLRCSCIEWGFLLHSLQPCSLAVGSFASQQLLNSTASLNRNSHKCIEQQCLSTNCHLLQQGRSQIRRPESACTVLILLCSIQKMSLKTPPNQNPKSKIQNPKSEIQNPKSKIQNPKSEIQNLKSKIRNPKSKIQNPKSEIQNPKSKNRNPKSKIRNPKSKIRNPKSKIPEIWGGGGLM